MTIRTYLRNRLSQVTGAQSGSTASTEPTITLRLFQLNWVVIAVTLAVFVTCELLTDFQLQVSGYVRAVGIAALCGLIGYLSTRSERTSNPRIYSIYFTLSQMMFVVLLLTSLGYIAASANLPMQDAQLLAFDRALGLDFHIYLDFINNRPRLVGAFMSAYNSIMWQNLAVVLVLPLIGHHRRSAEFVLGFAIALTATTIISTLLPATGVYGTLGLQPAEFPNVVPEVYYATLEELPQVRDGTIRLLDPFQLKPILTFPSFHAICAVLYTWAFWPIRWLKGIGLLWNAVMVLATPIGGGHYFVDVFAGLMIAALSIYVVRRVATLIASGPTQQASPQLLAAASIV